MGIWHFIIFLAIIVNFKYSIIPWGVMNISTRSGFLSRHNDKGFYIFTFLPEGTRAGVYIISFDI